MAVLILSGVAILIAGATMLDFETFALFVVLFAIAGGMILSNRARREGPPLPAMRHRLPRL